MKKQKDYNSYQIKKGDTLRNIALALGKDYSEVARFHNIYAKQDDLIGMEFPKTLKELFISPNISEKHIDNTPKTNFLYDSKLALKLFTKKLIYEVEISQIYQNEVFNLNCKKTVCYLKKIGDQHIFEIGSTLVNEDLSGISVEFSAVVVHAVYPLEVVINDDGNWVGIHNFESIAQRWQYLKATIRDNFEGIETEKRLLFYDAIFDNEVQCTTLLRNDIFLQTYFNNLFANHTRGFYFYREVCFALLPNIAPICFAIEQSVEEYLNDQNKIEIIQKGVYTDERSCVDLENELDEAYFGGEKPTGNYMANYQLNSDTHFIVSAELYCNLDLLEPIEINVRIQLVD
jgi:hypothetical protein